MNHADNKYCQTGISTLSLNVIYWSTTSIFPEDCSAMLPERRLVTKEKNSLGCPSGYNMNTLDDVKYE